MSPVGRPRSFDIDEALDKALKVFWKKGYEGTSMPDLTEAMGINRPSLYAAFGNKEELFRKAVDRYTEKSKAMMAEALSAPSARDAVERFLRSVAEASTCAQNPRGCLLVQGALSCGDTAESIRLELVKRRATSEAELCRRLERAKEEGDLPAHTNPADLARYFATVLQGMAVQTASGVGCEELNRVIDTAMMAWPKA